MTHYATFLRRILVFPLVAAALATISAAGPVASAGRPGGDQPPGQDGPQRPPLPCGKVCGIEIVKTMESTKDPEFDDVLTVIAKCPFGKIPIGGGFVVDGNVSSIHVITSAPYSDNHEVTLTGWVAEAWKDFTVPVEEHKNWGLHAWAICATVAQ